MLFPSLRIGFVGLALGFLATPPALAQVDFAASVSSGTPVAADDADEVAWVARHDIDDYPLTPPMGDLIETIWP